MASLKKQACFSCHYIQLANLKQHTTNPSKFRTLEKLCLYKEIITPPSVFKIL